MEMSAEVREPVYVVAKYEYNASSDQELSLRKNERLRLVDDSKQWWKVSRNVGLIFNFFSDSVLSGLNI